MTRPSTLSNSITFSVQDFRLSGKYKVVPAVNVELGYLIFAFVVKSRRHAIIAKCYYVTILLKQRAYLRPLRV